MCEEAGEGAAGDAGEAGEMNKQSKRTRMTITLDSSLIALARTAVHRTNGLTLASLIAWGLRLTIKRLEHQRGRRFRPQTIQLPAGRPRRRNHNPVATSKREG
jgi:hypothetical protein